MTSYGTPISSSAIEAFRPLGVAAVYSLIRLTLLAVAGRMCVLRVASRRRRENRQHDQTSGAAVSNPVRDAFRCDQHHPGLHRDLTVFE